MAEIFEFAGDGLASDNSSLTQKLMSLLKAYPAELHGILTQNIDRLKDLSESDCEGLKPYAEGVIKAFVVSDFLADLIVRFPAQVAGWLEEQTESQGDVVSKKRWSGELEKALERCSSEQELHRALRLFRREKMFYIVWKDLVEGGEFEVTGRLMTWLAEVCIDGALSWLHGQLVDTYGEPVSRKGQPQKMLVLGMGKLGAGELNVSSDIDLIFTFPEHGETQGASRSIDNQNFFTRLGQKLIQALDNTTVDGFVFRVDMRLRPYGQSGALALSFAAMEEYYEDQGRDWERYAMIKAAPVAGDLLQGNRLLDELRPFVYRKYIDFGAIQSLRSMKDMIEREVLRKGIGHNIKLGAGGIREVEFIAQVFQLIRGGRDIKLQQRGLLDVLQVIKEDQLMPGAAVDELRSAYIFLRNIEHAIQGLADKQTQQIPSDELGRLRIAIALGFSSWKACEQVLEQHRENVSRHFADVIASPQDTEESKEDLKVWRLLWHAKMPSEESVEFFEELGCADPQAFDPLLRGFINSSKVRQLQAQGKDRLDLFMPKLLRVVVEQKINAETFDRLLRFVEAIIRRSAYLVLLNENPGALKELVRLFGESQWVGEQIAQMPLLLDELLHSESLYTPPDTQTLRDELRQEMLRIPQDDLEEQMEVLRYFKRAHVLRVAASDLRGSLPLMKVSDYLTFIAETVLAQVLDQAWLNMTSKYGRPMRDEVTACDPDFGIIGYGKLGGIELSYGSDTDLVFLHDAAEDLDTDGDNSINNQVFFIRLGQRIIHLLTTKTASGDIYEVDMRLRPSGNSGLLVSSVAAWHKYQDEKAWTWEHQALVRARFVAGSESVCTKFERARIEVLTKPRDADKLKQDVLEMREKMRTSHATTPGADGNLPYFDLKHDSGGIVDIEFMVQYAALRWAHKHPSVVRWSDNIRILESLAEAGVVRGELSEELCEIYRQYRSRGHRLALQNLPARIAPEEMLIERERVVEFWREIFEE
ncbi:bifunctional [glutamate--ammonia ligase]-adenylyl-L-tyrosine phosphorylase/[glutamate--ammonia-ligase] adenylyltransferase [Hahella ganghwensis]|uniref:bifunctional [glutamate--ammonia ligase]-adenylyl-L-tyrosine phosphorylase/[glutamate--ammonia-ligase] adenylyltransferase n=1 Tax=Hahella ganghwensis TaxID=286420 RepID=UPI00036F1614|nr:bifunctional [glutamate--ammonia ligase]-adenylyl-L-tyrosine phosphorylase/[glutamate--ammonia-ligase] adenylyltransferase [Hahella ganghwensis]